MVDHGFTPATASIVPLNVPHISIDTWKVFQWVASAFAVAGSFGTLYLRKKAENLRFKAMLLSNENDIQFADETTGVLSSAAWQAYGRGAEAVECEHLLAAAVATNALCTYKNLQRHPDVRRIVNEFFDARAMPFSGSPIPYANRTAIALTEATTIAIERNSPIVTPDDLMAGIVRTRRGRAARALNAAGLSIDSTPVAKSRKLPEIHP